MLVLFETPAGYAVFKLLDEGKLAKSDSLYEDFDSLDKAKNIVKLKKFQKFEDTTEALAAATALVEGKMSKSLKKLLKKVVAEDAHEKLAVADAKLGTVIKEKLEMACVHDSKVSELMRCIRSQAAGLISGEDKFYTCTDNCIFCMKWNADSHMMTTLSSQTFSRWMLFQNYPDNVVFLYSKTLNVKVYY